MAEEKTYVFGEGAGSAGTVPAWLAGMNNNGLFGNNGWGGGILGFLLGLFFGNGWGGFGGFGGGNGAGAGFLANQMNNDSGRELLMTAITSNGEASRAAVQNLATMIGQDFNLVNSGVQVIENTLSSMAIQQAVSVPQIINSIQSGNSALASQLAQCCCENRLLTTQQGYEAQLRTLEQTNQLGSQADRNANSIINAINAQTVAMNDQFCAAKERDMQEKIDSLISQNAVLRGQIDNANQTAQITGYINSLVAPLQKEVSEMAAKQPNTVPVQYPNLVAVNNTPYTGGYGYGAGYGYGYGVPGGSYWG